MMKPFYVHRHFQGKLPNREPRGFTALVQENPENTRQLDIQVSFCAPKDQFNKKLGREFAAQAPIKTINKRQLPRMMAALGIVCAMEEEGKAEYWNYILKYVV